MSGYCFTDTETTGLLDEDPDARITQLASIRTDADMNIRGVFYSHIYLEPEKEISEYVQKLTGLNHDMLKHEPVEEAVLAAWLEFIWTDEEEDEPLIFAGFNAGFDLSIICHRLNATGLYSGKLRLKTPGYCLMKDSKIMLPDMPKRDNGDGTFSQYKLELVGPYLGIYGKKQHNALSDVDQTYRIAKRYKRMREREAAFANR